MDEIIGCQVRGTWTYKLTYYFVYRLMSSSAAIHTAGQASSATPFCLTLIARQTTTNCKAGGSLPYVWGTLLVEPAVPPQNYQATNRPIRGFRCRGRRIPWRCELPSPSCGRRSRRSVGERGSLRCRPSVRRRYRPCPSSRLP